MKIKEKATDGTYIKVIYQHKNEYDGWERLFGNDTDLFFIRIYLNIEQLYRWTLLSHKQLSQMKVQFKLKSLLKVFSI